MALSVQPRAEVEGDFIVVTLPGTTYRVLFSLSPDEPKLVQAQQLTVDREAPMSNRDFEARLPGKLRTPKRGSWAG
jgi:hypothetical protein